MSRSKLNEKHTLSAEGILNLENLSLEIEDIGEKDLKDLLARFNGCNVKINITLNNELM